MPPQSGENTLHPNSEQTSLSVKKLSVAHMKHVEFRRARMSAARDARAMKNYKFDDMTFDQWWEKCELADNSYIKPRTNKGDTEINMGVVRDKENTLLSLAMKYNYIPSAQVFNENDDIIADLAEDAEDLVTKSLHIEVFREKAKHIIRGMLTFGTQMVEELYLERWSVEKVLSGHVGSNASTWTDKLIKTYDGCISKPWDLRKCYFGDINKFYMNGPLGQPYFFTAEYLDYDSTKAIYGEWDMWEYVPTDVNSTPEAISASGFKTGWSLQPLTRNQCEITRYYDPIANEYAISINGIDMLPIQEKEIVSKGVTRTLISGFPLTAISPSGAIPFSKWDNEAMHNFAYSKSVPSKTRVIADVEDMVVKLMILGMKQMRRPPKGNKSSKVFSSDIFLPGTITNDIREGELFDLLPNQAGIQPAEFSFYEAMKQARDENSTTRNFGGQGNSGDTATQVIQDKEQQMDKVALMLDGVMSGYQQLFWLRTYNIFANWTKPIDQEIDTLRKEVKDIYRHVTLEKEIEGQTKAEKNMRFTTESVPGETPELQSQYVHQEELTTGKAKGKEMRISYLNPVQLKSMKLNWYYTVTPEAKNNDSMAQMMFAKAISDAIMFFGPESLNVAKLKRKYAIKYGIEFDTLFLDEEVLEQQQQLLMQQQADVTVPGAKPTIANTAQKKTPQLGTVMK